MAQAVLVRQTIWPYDRVMVTWHKLCWWDRPSGHMIGWWLHGTSYISETDHLSWDNGVMVTWHKLYWWAMVKSECLLHMKHWCFYKGLTLLCHLLTRLTAKPTWWSLSQKPCPRWQASWELWWRMCVGFMLSLGSSDLWETSWRWG